jgi:radical SAM protein with 4Fe4S-binding SPASM domain
VQQCAGRDVLVAPQGLGEPFLDPEFVARLTRAHELGLKYIDITTNATLMGEVAVRAVIASKVFLLSVEIDGADKAVYERSRPNADYDVVVANLQRVFTLRRELGSELPYVSISAIQWPDVVPSMPAFEALWRPLLGPMDEIFVAQPVTWAGDRPVPGRRAATPDELRTRPTCRMLYKTLQIYFDGRATPCTYDHACKLQVGDANTQTIEEIWQGDPLARLRRLHEQGRSGEIELCRNCPDHLA